MVGEFGSGGAITPGLVVKVMPGAARAVPPKVVASGPTTINPVGGMAAVPAGNEAVVVGLRPGKVSPGNGAPSTLLGSRRFGELVGAKTNW